MADTGRSRGAAPWAARRRRRRDARAPKKLPVGRLLPVVGPVLLFIVWDLVVRSGFIKAILLPTPFDTLTTLVTGLAGGPLLERFPRHGASARWRRSRSRR